MGKIINLVLFHNRLYNTCFLAKQWMSPILVWRNYATARHLCEADCIHTGELLVFGKIYFFVHSKLGN